MMTAALTNEELARLHEDGQAAADVFRATLDSLLLAMGSTDAVEILARAGFRLLVRGPDKVEQIGRPGLELFHLELIQALALASPRGAAGPVADYPAVTGQALDLIARNGQAYRDRAKLKMGSDALVNDQQRLVALIQGWTLVVRGARQEYQTRDYVDAVARAVDASFRHHHGCTASAFVAVLFRLLDLIEAQLQLMKRQFQRWGRKSSGYAMIEAYCAGLDPQVAAAIKARALPLRHERRQLFALLWALSEQRLKDVLTIAYADVVAESPEGERAALVALLRSRALPFGDVAGAVLEHLHLSNPVRLKPFIALDDDTFFCPVPHLVTLQLGEMLEDLCAAKPRLKALAEKARADWLEARLGNLVRRFLPSAEVREKVKWSEDGGATTWESDLVAVVDKTVLVFEAKSAKISGPARRGAVDSLRDAFTAPVVKPSVQSHRLKTRIEAAPGPIAFETRQGPFTIDAGAVRSVIRVNVLQDPVGPLSSHWPQLAAAGFIPADVDIAPSMTIFELESVFETLSLEIERCHYLSRRAELERNAVYTADELDLLAVYQDCQFNIGEDEFDGTHLQWYGWSLKISPDYAERRDSGTLAERLQRTPFWAALLGALEARRPLGWTRFGHRLLQADIRIQRRIEKLYREGLREVSRDPGNFFTSGVTFGAAARLDTVSVCIGAPDSPEQFQSNLDYAATSAFAQGGQDTLIVLYWFVPRTSEPYDFIGVMRRERQWTVGP